MGKFKAILSEIQIKILTEREGGNPHHISFTADFGGLQTKPKPPPKTQTQNRKSRAKKPLKNQTQNPKPTKRENKP